MNFTRIATQRVLTALEKAKIVCWFEETNSFAIVKRRYVSEFGMEPPSVDLVKNLHKRFLETGNVADVAAKDSIPMGAIHKAQKFGGSTAHM
uniref:DUF4817 domain-containing protein n=1 Tax=Parastrongyloides trichosuri TaxID=131310 RepID=A0A0N5A2M0_PARTI